MKRLIVVILLFVILISGCKQDKNTLSNVNSNPYSLDITRRLTVINAKTDKVVFELIGNFSYTVHINMCKIEIVCQTGDNEYKKHYVMLTQWHMYVIEDLAIAEIELYPYEINYMYEMISSIEPDCN